MSPSDKALMVGLRRLGARRAGLALSAMGRALSAAGYILAWGLVSMARLMIVALPMTWALALVFTLVEGGGAGGGAWLLGSAASIVVWVLSFISAAFLIRRWRKIAISQGGTAFKVGSMACFEQLYFGLIGFDFPKGAGAPASMLPWFGIPRFPSLMIHSFALPTLMLLAAGLRLRAGAGAFLNGPRALRPPVWERLKSAALAEGGDALAKSEKEAFEESLPQAGAHAPESIQRRV